MTFFTGRLATRRSAAIRGRMPDRPSSRLSMLAPLPREEGFDVLMK